MKDEGRRMKGREMKMRSAVIVSALYLLFSGAVVFAEGEGPVQKGIKEINRDATEVGHAVSSAVKKGRDEVNETADKMFKRKGKEKKEKKDKQEHKKEVKD